MKQFITIGTFDGVHIGHHYLFNKLETLAALHRLRAHVLYFPLPPKTLLSTHPEMSVLTLPDEKKALFQKAGVRAEALDFRAVRSLSPQQFFHRLCNQYQLGGLLVGADFAFGKNREGSSVFLRDACAAQNIPFEVLPFYKEGTDKISSSFMVLFRLRINNKITKYNRISIKKETSNIYYTHYGSNPDD